ncbi:MAG: SUMF1/EgtB/PvdO family nonheme iron enzyme [Bacteroidetes bacterium]|nr:SUMF1/EgtB/PvdO family nonheme iron enzyme [Bacteroidota bacterium]
MSGNVWEWCADYSHEKHEYNSAYSNAWKGITHIESRVVRGGSWCHDDRVCNLLYRSSLLTYIRGNYLGFSLQVRWRLWSRDLTVPPQVAIP